MNCRLFDLTLFVFVLVIVSAGRIVNANTARDGCSTNHLNVTCTFISEYGALFKRTPNMCYASLESITIITVASCNEQFLFDLFRNNDKIHVIGYKNESHRNFMKKLEDVKWNHNKLQSLERVNFTIFPVLKYLDLSFNDISNLKPRAFDAVSSTLRVLTLSYNNISHIEPGVFDQLNVLEMLSLNFNKLETLPLLRLPTLKTIYLNGNNLKSINGDFHSQFPLIESVYLMSNQLTELTLYDNGPTEVYLFNNQLSKFKIVANGTGSFLKSLHLPNNKLEQIEVTGPEPCNLNILDLSSNNVTEVAFLSKLRQLRTIHLANNNLSQLKNDDFRRLFIALRHLKALDLGTCRLEHTEEQFVLDGNYSGSSEIMELNE